MVAREVAYSHLQSRPELGDAAGDERANDNRVSAPLQSLRASLRHTAALLWEQDRSRGVKKSQEGR